MSVSKNVLLQQAGADSPISLSVTSLAQALYAVEHSGQTSQWHVTWTSEHGGVVRRADSAEQQSFYVWQSPEALHLWLSGEVFVFALPDKSPKRRSGGSSGAAAAGNVKSPMPGTILKILVAEGQAVDAGVPVVIMESMKMEMTLTASAASTVKQIHVGEAQLVEMNELLVSLEPLEGKV